MSEAQGYCMNYFKTEIMTTDQNIEKWCKDVIAPSFEKLKKLKTTNHRETILQYLQYNKTMTMRQGFNLGINQPQEYIRRLRNAGHNIELKWATGHDGTKYGVYHYISPPIEKETTKKEITYH